MYHKDFKNELLSRWTKVQSEMKSRQIDACFISSSVNLFYLSGRVFNGFIYVPANGEPLFFVRRPVGLEGENTFYIRKPEDIPAILNENNVASAERVAMESDVTPYNEFVRIAALFPGSSLENANTLLREVRMVKTPYEVKKLKESGIKHDALYAAIPDMFHTGMSDIDIMIEIERRSRKLGNLGLIRIFGSSMEIFMGSVLVGPNGDTPSPYDFALGGEGLNSSVPVGGNGSILRPGEAMMIDMNGNFTGYMTDMSRTYSIGYLNNELAQKAHQTSLDITEEFRKKCRPGVAVCDLYNMALDMAKERGLEQYFMGHSQQAGFIGHGVGIELNELPVIAPRSRHIFGEGMAFALEPKFVIPEVGAVGIENTFVVTSNGLQQLTNIEEHIIEL